MSLDSEKFDPEEVKISGSQEPQMLWGMKINTYSMLLHLSQLGNFVLPGAGVVAPILLWVLNKDQSALVDVHGKNVLNWMITELIYVVISIALVFVFIGIPLFLAVVILGIVFPIIGAVKANDGVVWPYPLSIKFFN